VKDEIKIAVIGGGSWGTAISALLARKGYSVNLWVREKGLAETIKLTRTNTRYLPEIVIPANVLPTSDLSEAVNQVEVVALAVPSHVMRQIVEQLRDLFKSSPLLISLTKGMEINTLMRMSEVIKSELPSNLHSNIAVLSGPNHAEEVSRDIPSATVISAYRREVALRLQELFMTPYFRVYTNPDLIGVELGGATKNVIAIAAGISDGLGYGDNTKASLMTRGLAEITRLGAVLGANPLTFAGLSGIGDLAVTCTSRYSRNRAVGEKIGRGMSLAKIFQEMTMVAEGVRTSLAVRRLAEQKGVEMPITKNVTEVLYEGKDPHKCVSDLMERGAAEEFPWNS